MSDYLHHLVARTLSPEAGVRPQLRSAFEPPPLHGGFTLPVELENEPAQFERVPSPEALNAAPTMSPTGDGTPRQIVPPPRPLSTRGDVPPHKDKNIAPVQPFPPPDQEPSMKPKVLQPVRSATPDSVPENSQPVSAPPSPLQTEPVPVPRRILARPQPDRAYRGTSVVSHQTVESEEPQSVHIAVAAIRSVASAATVLSASPLASVRPRLAAEVHNQTVESEERHRERTVVAAIRPVPPAAPVYSPSLAPAVALPPPIIHVTIGRVEIRATLPPAGSRSKAAPPPVMGLEEYLARRASGGQR